MRYMIEPIFESYEEEEQESVYEALMNEARIQPRKGAELWLFSITSLMTEM